MGLFQGSRRNMMGLFQGSTLLSLRYIQCPIYGHDMWSGRFGDVAD